MMKIAKPTRPVRLWSPLLIAAVAFFGALLEIGWPDGPHAEGRHIREQIEAMGLPTLVTAFATTAVRIWTNVLIVVPLFGVGTAAGALLLAALNWRRMGQPHAFVTCMLFALAVAALPRAKLFGEGIYLGYVLTALTHIALGVWLYLRQRRDIAQFRRTATQTVRRASLLLGLLIAGLGAITQSALTYGGLALTVQAGLLLGGATN